MSSEQYKRSYDSLVARLQQMAMIQRKIKRLTLFIGIACAVLAAIATTFVLFEHTQGIWPATIGAVCTIATIIAGLMVRETWDTAYSELSERIEFQLLDQSMMAVYCNIPKNIVHRAGLTTCQGTLSEDFLPVLLHPPSSV